MSLRGSDMGMEMGKAKLYETACFWKAHILTMVLNPTSSNRLYRDRLTAGSQEGTWLLPGVSILFRMPGFLIPE